ncbi:osmoprotectant transport system permease protein [Pelagirhabdus alkalitolerans]|uniref:Osmoprotectant transport system permease protein n=1 Tax=Pelagirhabdus alkalitolerans TaxID=1612202 RepID=A0A1G6N807_9BACI|nr:ABC transporter permease [Pelagirhabdus alkalitolerans]SDC63992.1 osmoprotectant transport system permease protein [Pelagirhabdus alkalitolerans]
MDFLIEVGRYMANNSSTFVSLTIEHIIMVVQAIAYALIAGVPLGILAAKYKKLAPVILSLVNILQLIPSIAMLAILLIYFGMGTSTVVIGLFFYSLLPIVRNTYVGIKEVDPGITEAGKGIGMTPLQLLAKVQFPLSIPFLMAGLRVAAVIAVAVATIAPYIGGGGLGREIVSGINLQNEIRLVAGAIPAAVLAIIADFLLGKVENKTKRRFAN